MVYLVLQNKLAFRKFATPKVAKYMRRRGLVRYSVVNEFDDVTVLLKHYVDVGLVVGVDHF